MIYDSVIGILTYSKADFLKGCLDSILNTVSDFSKNVIVIANNSEDEAYIAEIESIVRSLQTNVTTINFRRNRGTSAAWNAIARAYQAKNIAIFNDDILVWPGWIEAMRTTLDNPAVGVAGLIAYHGWSEWNRRNTQPVEDALQHLTYQHLIYPGGSCLLFRQSVFQEIGGFDEGLWTGFEEVDFSMRAMELGYFNIQTGVAGDGYRFVSHYGSGTGYDWGNAAAEIRQHNQPTNIHFEQKWGFPFPPTEEQQQALRQRRDQKARERGLSL